MARKAKPTPEKESRPECIIIMPISEIDGCGAEHCGEVLNILKEAVEKAGFEPKPAWENSTRDVIHKKIIENLYNAPLAICDVSGQNPNVMFELGMRLAFDKPTLIVKDGDTDFCFDIGGLHHETYPRDLRISATRDFIQTIATLLKEKYEASTKDGYQSFLKTLGPFKAEIPDTVQVPPAEISYDEIRKISSDIQELKNSLGVQVFKGLMNKSPDDFCLIGVNKDNASMLISDAMKIPGVKSFTQRKHGQHTHCTATFHEGANVNATRSEINSLIQRFKS